MMAKIKYELLTEVVSADNGKKILSVAELTRNIRLLLENHFPGV